MKDSYMSLFSLDATVSSMKNMLREPTDSSRFSIEFFLKLVAVPWQPEVYRVSVGALDHS